MCSKRGCEMLINVVIPTFKRPQMLKKTLKSLEKCKYPLKRVWVIVDGKDFKTVDMLRDGFFHVHILINLKRKDAVFSYNKVFRLLDSGAILIATDDLVFHKNCISNAATFFSRRFPNTDGLVGLNQLQDGRPKGRKYAFCLMGRKFFERYKKRVVFCPDYVHFNGDREIGIYGKQEKRFHFLESARVDHIRLDDETTSLGKEVYQKDRDTWNKRQSRGLLWGKSFELIN
jgi:glycosyltransferase involved in cell wall biosynthesis